MATACYQCKTCLFTRVLSTKRQSANSWGWKKAPTWFKMLTRIQSFLKDYKVMLIMIPALAGIHYTWYQMQKNPELIEKGKETKFFGKKLEPTPSK